MLTEQTTIAEWVWEQRDAKHQAQSWPKGQGPQTLTDAYAAQKDWVAQAERRGETVAAWKLGGTTATTRQAFQCTRAYYGPILASQCYGNGRDVAASKLYAPLVEVEIAFRIGAGGAPVAAMLAMESPSTIWQDVKALGLPALLADGCASGALVLGPEIHDWQTWLQSAHPIRLWAGDTLLTEGTTANIIGGPLAALAEATAEMQQHGQTLAPGTYVSTGGCTPCVTVPLNTPLRAEAGPSLLVEALFRP